jgi:hypothetical protein
MRATLALFIFQTLLLISDAGLYVISPKAVTQVFKEKYNGKNSLENSLANFGNPPYGTSIIGRVYYLGGEGKRSEACEALPSIDWSSDHKDSISVSPILLVDRGTCSFV